MKTSVIGAVALSFTLASCADKGESFSWNSKQNNQGAVDPTAYSSDTVDAYTALLRKYVFEETVTDKNAKKERQTTLVNYKAWRENAADLQALRDFVEKDIGQADLTDVTENEYKAFYINAYNAVVLLLIIDNYDRISTSIEDIPNVWQDPVHTVAGTKNLTLNQIENSYLLLKDEDVQKQYPNFKLDARAHFAVNCASMSCPPLRREAFKAETLDQQLDEMVARSVNSGDIFIDEPGKISVSPLIHNWYNADFEFMFGTNGWFWNSKAKVGVSDNAINLMVAYYAEGDRPEIAGWTIDKRADYNWELNQTFRPVDDGEEGEPPPPPVELDTYSKLLQKYVVSQKVTDKNGFTWTTNLVDYEAWSKHADDKAAMTEYVVEVIGKTDTSEMNENEFKAFYLNAYNSLIINLANHKYEKLGKKGKKTIKKLRKWFTGVFDRKIHTVAGKNKVSFNYIEHEVLRKMHQMGKGWKLDARIHVGLNCASLSCPALHPYAFRAETLDQTLDELSAKWVNRADNVFVPSEKTVSGNPIMGWFEGDFKSSFGSLVGFVAEYVDPSVHGVSKQEFLDSWKVTKRGGDKYDWSLNEPQSGGSQK